jgi:hypothetical protein
MREVQYDDTKAFVFYEDRLVSCFFSETENKNLQRTY